AGNTAISDVCNAEREDDAKDKHEDRTVIGAAEGVGPELIQQISAENCCDTHHDPWVHPVIKVACPSGDELGDSGELVRVGLCEEGLLSVQVGRTWARIEFCQFRVADCCGETEQQGEENAKPHRYACHRRSVKRLHLK